MTTTTITIVIIFNVNICNSKRFKITNYIETRNVNLCETLDSSDKKPVPTRAINDFKINGLNEFGVYSIS